MLQSVELIFSLCFPLELIFIFISPPPSLISGDH